MQEDKIIALDMPNGMTYTGRVTRGALDGTFIVLLNATVRETKKLHINLESWLLGQEKRPHYESMLAFYEYAVNKGDVFPRIQINQTQRTARYVFDQAPKAL